MSLTVDKTKISFNEFGLVRVDGVAAFRKEVRDGVIYIEFIDHDRMRSQCRGTKFVEIPLDELIVRIREVEGNGNVAK